MTKRIPILGSLLLAAFGAFSATLQPDEALARLMMTDARKLPSKGFNSPQLKMTTHSPSGEAAVYVFGVNSGDGYMLLSADEGAAPLLGYADKGDFNPESMPPALKYWIDSYTRQITMMRASSEIVNNYTGVDLPDDWSPVGPLLSTTWDQTAPYNDSCPDYRGRTSVTGCVATAMAQTMNYFKYPEVGRDSVKYRSQTIGKNIACRFSDYPIDWENMLDSYQNGYTDEQAAAVATLMQLCGKAVKMDYSPDMSGAYTINIPTGLVRYFNYDEGLHLENRNDYSYSEWASMIYDNLKNVGPVIYNGQAPLQGGHSFICDGYDGNGYFHFNWGWSGISDGYFLLDALSPEVIGTGGYTGGFSMAQDAILGIQPPTGNEDPRRIPTAVQYGFLTASVNADTLMLGIESETYAGWGYTGQGAATFDFGAIIENIDNPEEEIRSISSLNFIGIKLSSGQYIQYDSSNPMSSPQFSLDTLNLSEGDRYKFTFAARDTTVNDEWIPVRASYGFPNYTIVSRTDTSYSVTDVPFATFSVSDIEIPSKVRINEPISITFSISNKTGMEVSRNMCALMGNETSTSVFITDSYLLTLAPGDSIRYTLVSHIAQLSGRKLKEATEFELMLGDLSTGYGYEHEPLFLTLEPEESGIKSVDDLPAGHDIYFNRTTRELTASLSSPIVEITVTGTDAISHRYSFNGNDREQTVILNGYSSGVYIVRATASDGTEKTMRILL